MNWDVNDWLHNSVCNFHCFLSHDILYPLPSTLLPKSGRAAKSALKWPQWHTVPSSSLQRKWETISRSSNLCSCLWRRKQTGSMPPQASCKRMDDSKLSPCPSTVLPWSRAYVPSKSGNQAKQQLRAPAPQGIKRTSFHKTKDKSFF